MKKLFSLLGCILLLAAGLTDSAQAQRVYSLPGATGYTTDTVVNTATKTQTIRVDGYQDAVTIQVVLTKISGTAAGKVYLLGSIDGANYIRAGGADSLVVTNVATQSGIFKVTNSPYLYYRTSYTGSGTQSVKIQAKAIWRKR